VPSIRVTRGAISRQYGKSTIHERAILLEQFFRSLFYDLFGARFSESPTEQASEWRGTVPLILMDVAMSIIGPCAHPVSDQVTPTAAMAMAPQTA